MAFFLFIVMGSMSLVAAHSREKASFAGGCFWCMEEAFEKVTGVISVESGFMGDNKVASYKDVSAGQTKHVETVLITYDPHKISFTKLLFYYWRNVDPTDLKGQFVDRGPHYRPVIFYFDSKQKKLAEDSKKQLQKKKIFAKPIIVEILAATPFYAAADYHQDYYKKNPLRYSFYKSRSGRPQFLERYWSKKK